MNYKNVLNKKKRNIEKKKRDKLLNELIDNLNKVFSTKRGKRNYNEFIS